MSGGSVRAGRYVKHPQGYRAVASASLPPEPSKDAVGDDPPPGSGSRFSVSLNDVKVNIRPFQEAGILAVREVIKKW
jgi:hypothetical protein